MGPTRTPKTLQRGEPSQPGALSKRKSKRAKVEKDSSSLPGVQKLKSSLRQTRRLLSKDNLAADVRVETERKLKALEADLASAETSKKERKLATRYHKIKFFERQKVVRKLNQIKHRLSSASKSSKTQLEATLLDLRVDLNYILNYPKTKKYISLFPPEVRQGLTSVNTTESERTKTDTEREQVRCWVRQRMERGELSQEPELHLSDREADVKKGAARGTGDREYGSAALKNPGQKPTQKNGEVSDVELDNFFGDDDEEEDDQDSNTDI